MNHLCALLTTARPRFWLYLAGPVLVGLAFGIDSFGRLTDLEVVALLVYFLIPANLYLYGVNDIFDASIDQLNPKKAGRERRFTGDRVIVGGVIVSLLLGLALLIILPRAIQPWLLGFFFLATAYSVPPIRFKVRPLFDSISNGLYILPGVAAYVLVAEVLPPTEVIVGAWLWTMAMHTYSAIPDIVPDRAGGIRTTATILGKHGALAYCGIIWMLAAIAFGVVDLRAGLLLSVYPMLVILVAVSPTSVRRAYWAYPVINTIVGMVFVIAGFWEVTHG